jgi:uncharacterized protein with HEPN domain
MTPGDRIRLQQMLEAIDAGMGFIRGRSREDLGRDQMLVFACIRAVEVVGEAAVKISPATREAIPEVPLAAIVGVRNRLVRAHFRG